MNRLDYMIDWSNRVTELYYDEVGRLRFIYRPNGTQRETRYNAAGEITQIWERDPNRHIIHLQKITKRDGNGNIEKQLTVPLPQTQTINPVNSTYNDDNSLATVNGLTIEHDDDGNMTNGPILEDSLHTYTYSRNRLTSAGGISSTYDAHNNLIAQDYWQYIVNPNASLSQILKAQKGSDIRHYIYGAGLLYEEKSDGSIITYHFDHLGNTVALSDESGTIISRREYTPYGSTSHHTGTHDTPFWYGGRYGVITADNGLMSMRARWYNPYLRRFVSQDPIGFDGGLNWFVYANGNPVNAIDPLGLFTFGYGLSLSGNAFGAGGTLGYQTTFSWSSSDGFNIGIVGYIGGGLAAGAPSASLTFDVSVSDNNSVNNLSGTSVEGGGSGALLGIVLSGSVAQSDNAENIYTGSIGVGGPNGAEGHGYAIKTGVLSTGNDQSVQAQDTYNTSSSNPSSTEYSTQVNPNINFMNNNDNLTNYK